MNEFIINFEDLNPDAQRRLLAFVGVAYPEDAGYDNQPVAIVMLEEPIVDEVIVINEYGD